MRSARNRRRWPVRRGWELRGFTGSDLRARGLGTFTGDLRSEEFTIRGDTIDFLIGGGRYKNRTCLSLYAERNGAFVQARSTTGENNLDLVRRQWDVEDLKGQRAYLLITDHAPIEPLMHGIHDNPNEHFGFIVVDDIRQLNKAGQRVAKSEDEEHNFDFERVRTPHFAVTAEAPADNGGEFTQDFRVTSAGPFHTAVEQTQVRPSLYKLNVDWSYRGPTLLGVKLGLVIDLPLTKQACQYYLLPPVLYNGNPIGQAVHYFGEDVPEDALSIPGGYSVEDGGTVYGGWVWPQRAETDAKASVRLEEDPSSHRLRAVYEVPPSAVFGQSMGIDVDQQLTARNGVHVHKAFYIYVGPKAKFAGLSNEKQGYGQVLRAAWESLYASSPTNPPRSLTDDSNMRLRSLLDPYALIEDAHYGAKTYRIWYVGRWELPADFNFRAAPLVPEQYTFHYTGFSWSGMLGRASYTALEDYLTTGNKDALQLAMTTLDFFADNGMSPGGILYQAYYDDNHSGAAQPGFGTYAGEGAIDMGPLGEELYWYLKSYELLKAHGVAEKETWLADVRSSLDAVMKLYLQGDIPGRISGKTGLATERPIPLLKWPDDGGAPVMTRSVYHYAVPLAGGPTPFVYLIWAYTSYYQYCHDARYLNYAELLGDQMLAVINRYGRFGGSEMDWFSVDKRMSHATLAAFNDLYAATGDRKWLNAAIEGGNAFASWEYAYNVSFDGFGDLPLGHFDYRTIGGTSVSVIMTTNNTAFDQGATEFVRLWDATGDMVWFERARALLHQGTESSLDDAKRTWLNAHYQGPGDTKLIPFNPHANFDVHSNGGGTEDVLPAWPGFKGNWTTKKAAIMSMYMFAQSFDWLDIKQRFGSLSYSFRWNDGGALDTLDRVTMKREGNRLEITAHNMIGAPEVYTLKLLDFPGESVRIGGQVFDRKAIDAGVPIAFKAGETKTFVAEWGLSEQ